MQHNLLIVLRFKIVLGKYLFGISISLYIHRVRVSKILVLLLELRFQVNNDGELRNWR